MDLPVEAKRRIIRLGGSRVRGRSVAKTRYRGPEAPRGITGTGRQMIQGWQIERKNRVYGKEQKKRIVK